MRVTTGVDIIEVQRIQEAICELGDSFLRSYLYRARSCLLQKVRTDAISTFCCSLCCKRSCV